MNPLTFKIYGDTENEWIRVPAELIETLTFTPRGLSSASHKTPEYYYVDRSWDEEILARALAPETYGLNPNVIKSFCTTIRRYRRVNESDDAYLNRTRKGPKERLSVEYYCEQLKALPKEASEVPQFMSSMLNQIPPPGKKHHQPNANRAVQEIQKFRQNR